MADELLLDFAARRRRPIRLTFPEGTYTIDPNVFVDDMADMQQVEEEIHAAEQATDDETRALLEGRRLIMHFIRRQQPDAPELRMRPGEILATLAALAGNTTATDEVLTTLTAGQAAADDTAPDAARTAAEGDAAEAAPFGSPRRSPRRSSSSGRAATAASRTGGGKSPGGSSKASSGS